MTTLLPDFNEYEKHALLRLARQSLTHYCKTQTVMDLATFNEPITDRMKEPYGAFVTLKIMGDLRGCIGTIIPEYALAIHVLENAIKSGVQDYRFSPVQSTELPGITFEITVLSPPHPVASYEEIQVEHHGIILNKNGHKSLFLPQVATEQGWDLETTLAHLSQKAGLSSTDWKENTSFSVFEGLEFSE